MPLWLLEVYLDQTPRNMWGTQTCVPGWVLNHSMALIREGISYGSPTTVYVFGVAREYPSSATCQARSWRWQMLEGSLGGK